MAGRSKVDHGNRTSGASRIPHGRIATSQPCSRNSADATRYWNSQNFGSFRTISCKRQAERLTACVKFGVVGSIQDADDALPSSILSAQAIAQGVLSSRPSSICRQSAKLLLDHFLSRDFFSHETFG